MNPIVLSLLMLTSASHFDGMKNRAEEVQSLRKTVTTILGVCDAGDVFEKQECKQTLKARRAKFVTGKSFYLYMGAQEQGLASDGVRKGKSRLLWTPVLDVGDGVAITIAKPKRISKRGGVVVPTKVLDVSLENDFTHDKVNRLIRTGQLSVELVGTFGRTWKMRRQQGVIFQPKGIRFSHARTGETVAEVTY